MDTTGDQDVPPDMTDPALLLSTNDRRQHIAVGASLKGAPYLLM
jgi:hypothetical protein